jgi:hypothetical protein
MKLRRELPEFMRGDEVLARSPHTGWYYRRLIEDFLGSFKYRISFKDVEIVPREDIIFIQSATYEVTNEFLEVQKFELNHLKYFFMRRF